MADGVSNVVQLSPTTDALNGMLSPTILDDAPFHTISTAAAALDNLELAIELSRRVLAMSEIHGDALVLAGVKQVMVAAVALAGL